MATNDVSPYLQRPVRTLEEVIAEVEQQRLGPPASVTAVVIPASRAGDASSAGGSAVGKEPI